MSLFGEEELPKAENYTVLARKYRPRSLDEVIGQEALVRTLKNALASGRLAHAFLLTGIRGVGKTSTARIIARVLNNIPIDQTIDGNPDVIEMDAASNTSVDDVREIIEAAKYRPLAAPYKIYIIDEVHMLSKGAFNALLKTLEEPPAHVKFIFATTEIRKVPVTILSRCQRFDLRRVDSELIASHLKEIAHKEKLEIDNEALRLISNAAEGSVRDSLSLLDQATAYSGGKITGEIVAEMLGYAEREQVVLLFEEVMSGKIELALEIFNNIASTSAEPLAIMQDMLEYCHLVTRAKVTPGLKADSVTESELERAKAHAAKLSMSSLTLVWQLMLKAIKDIRIAPNPKHAAEMGIIRIAYAADFSGPDTSTKQPIPKAAEERNNMREFEADYVTSPNSYAELTEVFRAKKELVIYENLRNSAHLVSFAPEKLEIRLAAKAAPELANKVAMYLTRWTGKRWVVAVSNQQGEPTLLEQERQKFVILSEEAKKTAIVQKVFEYFPEAEIIGVKEMQGTTDLKRRNV